MRAAVLRQFPLWLLAFLLLPALFQTVLAFQSGGRGLWELLYLVLALTLCIRLWRGREDRGGRWSLLLAPAALLGGCFAQNPLLGVALAALAVVLLAAARLPLWVRIPGCVLLSLATALLGLLCLFSLVLSGVTTYTVPVPGGAPGSYAEVTVVDPGAAGRVRYHAVEQRALVDLAPVLRVSVVTGRDTAPSGQGRYGYVIDDYFS